MTINQDSQNNDQQLKGRVMPFTESVNQSLLFLYHRGMTGWGKKKAHFIDIAKSETGLDAKQIKVRPH